MPYILGHHHHDHRRVNESLPLARQDDIRHGKTLRSGSITCVSAWLQAKSNGVNTPDVVDTNSHETHHICVSTGEQHCFTSMLWIIKCIYSLIEDPEEGAGGLDPPGKSQVIWVSIGNKQSGPSPLENVGPALEPWKMIDFFKMTVWFL